MAARQPARTRPAQPAAVGFLRGRPFGRQREGLVNYVRELRAEVRKVIWPTRREWMNLTAVVLALSAVVGAFLGLVDFIFQEFFRFILRLGGQGF